MGIVGDGRWWLAEKNRGVRVALMWHGWRAEGLYWIGEMGERRGFFFFFSFFGEVVGCGSDGWHRGHLKK